MTSATGSNAVLDGEEQTMPQQPTWTPTTMHVPSTDNNMRCTFEYLSPDLMELGSVNDYSAMQEHNYNHLQPYNVDTRMMETFLNGFGAADLIT